MRYLCLLVVVCGCSISSAALLEKSADVAAFIDELVEEYGFKAEVLENVFKDIEVREDILELISRPAEGTMTWDRYRKIFITEKRIREGIEFAQQHRQVLTRAEAEFKVPAHLIVAIIGVETSYGKIKGSYPVLEALATLGFQYPRRASFFRGQLKEFFVLVCEEGISPFDETDACNLSKSMSAQVPVDDFRELLGSYAGAMGIGQFIPSSYRDFAIDYDGDQYRDIWNNPTDAIGSVANYFKVHGWQNVEPVLLEVALKQNNTAELMSLANQTLELQKSVREWQRLGLEVAVDDLDLKAALFRFETAERDIHKLGFHDFYVITRYNHSRLYAAAVWELAELIKQGQ